MVTFVGGSTKTEDFSGKNAKKKKKEKRNGGEVAQLFPFGVGRITNSILTSVPSKCKIHHRPVLPSMPVSPAELLANL